MSEALVDLRPILQTREFRALLSLLVCWRNDEGDQARLDQAIRECLLNSELRMLGFERSSRPVALLGIKLEEADSGIIRHLIVDPESRGQGFGRELIHQAQAHLALRRLSAETHKDAVAFYRRSGFRVSSLGEKYPGVERFHCERDSAHTLKP